MKQTPQGNAPTTQWCRLCGTQHATDRACPAQVHATGPEERRWRLAADTPEGARGFGVLVAEAGDRWCARIMTFPNILWMVPGGGETLKFLAETEEHAVRQAVDFIRQHCVAKGFVMRDEVQLVQSLRSGEEPGTVREYTGSVARRYRRRLPVSYGRSRPTIPGFTDNLSETGLFVVTDTPLPGGVSLGLLLQLEHCKVPLRAAVAWRRTEERAGQERGMGLRLVNPPPVYVDYVHALD